MSEKSSLETGLASIKTILIAVDRSGYRERIINYAIILAKFLGEEIIALHVIDRSSLGAAGVCELLL